jgi:hypothetical protein
MASVATQPQPTILKKKRKLVAVSARRAAAFAIERDRLFAEAADLARAEAKKRRKQAKNKAPQEQAPQQEEGDDQDKELAAFVRAHACARAVYEGVLPRPLQC